MKFKFNKNFLFWTALFACFFLARAGCVFAIEGNYPSFFGITISDATTLPVLIEYVLNIAIAFAAFLSVILIAIGGIAYGLSWLGGKFTNEARDRIKSGLTGLVIVLLAWLICNTINPDLLIFRLNQLPVIQQLCQRCEEQNPLAVAKSFFLADAEQGFFCAMCGNITEETSKISTAIYNEIPAGKAVENVLIDNTYCYDFNIEGDPITTPMTEITNSGKEEKIQGPTLLNHPRRDCVLKLMEAATRKALQFEALSNKIANLMDTCQCDGTKCASNCGHSQEEPCFCPGQDVPLPDYECDSNGNVFNPALSCPDSQTENNSDNSTDYNFQNSIMAVISGLIPKALAQTTDSSGCKAENCPGNPDYTDPNQNCGGCANASCSNNAGNCCSAEVNKEIEHGGIDIDAADAKYPMACLAQNRIFKGLDEFRTTKTGSKILAAIDQFKKIKEIPDNQITVMNLTEWNNLNLIEQLMYFDEKIKEMTAMDESTSTPVSQLMQVKNELSKKSCYLLTSYPSLLDKITTTKQNEKQIKIQKTIPADTSKYCAGYNYANSQCYLDCQKLCPESGPVKDSNGKTVSAMDCYNSCARSSNVSLCVQSCFNNRLCENSPNKTLTWSECLQECPQECDNSCIEKNNCQEACQNPADCPVPSSNDSYCTCPFNSLWPGVDACEISGNSWCADNLNVCCGAFDENGNAITEETDQNQQDVCPSGTAKAGQEKDSRCFEHKNGQILVVDPKDPYCCGPDEKPADYSGELLSCQGNCEDDSLCLYRNEDKCIMKMSKLNECAGKYSDLNELLNCIDNAYLCKYGSNQNAGYNECLNSSYNLGDESSSDFIFKNPQDQLCFGEGAENCAKVQTQAAKCQALSRCPDCPCGIIPNPPVMGPKAGTCVCPDGTADPSMPASCCADGLNIKAGSQCDIEYCQSENNYSSSFLKPQKTLADILPGSKQLAQNDEYGEEYCDCPSGTQTFNSIDDPECCSENGDINLSCCRVEPSPKPSVEPEVTPVPGAIYTAVEPNCSFYSRKDDPLLMYCQNEWWNKQIEDINAEPLGNTMTCSKADEIPVGQLIDDTLNYVKAYKAEVQKFTDKLEAMESYVKGIGKQNGYCQCNSTCNGSPICKPSCEFHIKWVNKAKKEPEPTPEYKECYCENKYDQATGENYLIPNVLSSCCQEYTDGNYYVNTISDNIDCLPYMQECQSPESWIEKLFRFAGVQTASAASHKGKVPSCWCTTKPCEGFPCQQMIKYLRGGTTADCSGEEAGVGKYANDVYDTYENFARNTGEGSTGLATTVTDLLKMLTYSRQKADECGAINNSGGQSAKIYNCTWVMDNLMPEIIQNGGANPTIAENGSGQNEKFYNFCYGQYLGLATDQNLTDNWFCCKTKK